jgi:exosome complex exonuclease DIS3/RRP44
LLKVSKKLRDKRFAAGALLLASPEVKFIRDEATQDPIDLELYEQRETNALVEEYMLLANISVAKKLYEKYPSLALLRRHPQPASTRFTSLQLYLQKLGYDLQTSSSLALSQSLDAINDPNDPYFNKLVRMLTTRCISQALYFSSGTVPYNLFLHFGLATPIYTHFTSPIRRYADLIVHRLLGAAINLHALPNYDKNKIRSVCHVINQKHTQAQFASRASVELYTHLYFKDRKEASDGYITRLRTNAITVICPKFGLEGNVFLPEGMTLQLDKDGCRLFSPDNKFQLRMLEKVQVTVSLDSSKPHRPTLHFSLTSPQFSSLSNVPSDKKRKGDSGEQFQNKLTKKRN